VAQQSVTKMKYLLFVNLFTPKARVKHEPLFNSTNRPLAVIVLVIIRLLK